MEAVFKTQRLLLRYANEHDAAMLLTLVNQPNFIKYIGDKAIYTHSDAKRYIEQSFRASHKHQGFGPYIITLHNGEVVGVVGFYKRDVLQLPDLGFALLTRYEKNGYIFEAAKALLHNRHTLGIKQVSAICAANNTASQCVLLKLGFNRVGKAVINNDKTAVIIYGY
ncbi:N-acetyltransferase [Pseudoalteromonas sp. S327]|uniref:GNAT family N-acetyltransferase n=1 Tax=unclassified Pseudoalteromonas TaxID=194690 RepID=UPI00110B9C0C|nr:MULTISPECIES: GNAT family N-acetyltransferase [unclassified Pseudoalteromonas]TMO08884.1 N-acetyltransferase [Pseudoalteromonas sp. S327]TMO16072.1 N-acetyltransferase [Pseudoalteromonas sp. S326]